MISLQLTSLGGWIARRFAWTLLKSINIYFSQATIVSFCLWIIPFRRSSNEDLKLFTSLLLKTSEFHFNQFAAFFKVLLAFDRPSFRIRNLVE